MTNPEKMSQKEAFEKMTESLDLMLESLNKGESDSAKAMAMLTELNTKMAGGGVEKLKKEDLAKPHVAKLFEKMALLTAKIREIQSR